MLAAKAARRLKVDGRPKANGRPTAAGNATAAVPAQRSGELADRVAELEATVAALKATLAKVNEQTTDVKRLAHEEGRALQFLMLDVNEIRRDLDGVMEGNQQ
jgi:hypothetical protein